MAEEAHRRYAEIMKDVEDMIDDHSTERFLLPEWEILSPPLWRSPLVRFVF